MTKLITGDMFGRAPVTVCGYEVELKEFNVIAKSRWQRFASDEQLQEAGVKAARLREALDTALEAAAEPDKTFSSDMYKIHESAYKARLKTFTDNPASLTPDIEAELHAEAERLSKERAALKEEAQQLADELTEKVNSMKGEIKDIAQQTRSAKLRFVLSLVTLKDGDTIPDLLERATPDDYEAADLIVLAGNATTSESPEVLLNREARRAKN